MQVGEIMSPDVMLASPDETVKTAATLMAQANCGALPVAENNGLVGLVTDRDIALRAVAMGTSPNRCTVREVMSRGIKYVYDDETTEAAVEKMSTFANYRFLTDKSVWSASFRLETSP